MQDPSVPRDLTLNDRAGARDQRGIGLVLGYIEDSVQTSDAVGVKGKLSSGFGPIERWPPSRLELISCFKRSLISSCLPRPEVFALSLTAKVLVVLPS
jgi:hypothetical protein